MMLSKSGNSFHMEVRVLCAALEVQEMIQKTMCRSKVKKNRPRKKKSKNRSLNLNLKPTLKNDQEEHSKKLSLVFQECEESFKEIRQFLNALNLERTPPKQKSSPGKSAPKVSLLGDPSNKCIGCKAGKLHFVVQVGKVKILYKTRKPSAS